MPKTPYRGRERRSPRLQGYDYAQDGGYFITINTKENMCLFGEIVEEAMQLNPAGEMVQACWLELAERYPTCELDAYVVMPNHLHGIIFINNDPKDEAEHVSLSTMMQWFKTVTTNGYIRGVRAHEWPRFPGRLWHGRFYDHIIRHDGSLERIRAYIANNPAKWALDRLNPEKMEE
jgi:REP element-mobilizing transposase RayT